MSDVSVESKRILPFAKPLTDFFSPFAEPVLRIATGAMLVPHGYSKLFVDGTLDGVAGFFEQVGFTPGYPLALTVALIEFVGGLLLIAGLLTRPAAVAIAVFLGQAVLFHAGSGFFWTDGGYEYPLLWAIAALFFAVRGGGKYSVDRLIGKEF